MPYRIEYAKQSRAGCKGPAPCKGTKIQKGELRLGSLVRIPKPNGSGETNDAPGQFYAMETLWLRLLQISPFPKGVFTNMKKDMEDVTELDGFEDLREEDQEKLTKAWEAGHVDDADIPESAKKPESEPEVDEDGNPIEKPAKKKAAPKRKKKDEDADAEEKPKKKRAPKKKKTDDDDDDEEEKPKKKKAAAKKKAKKSDSEEVEEAWEESE